MKMKKSIILFIIWVALMIAFFAVISAYPAALTPNTTSLFGALSFALLVAFVVTVKRERDDKKYK